MAATGTSRSKEFQSGVLVLPRTRVLQRLFLVPTDSPKEIEQMLRYRLPGETPFLLEDLDWTWRVVEERSDGFFLVKVTLVEKNRMKSYLEEAGLGSDLRGAVVEDEFLTACQIAEPAGGPSDEVHLYQLQHRLIANLVRENRCLASNVVSINGDCASGTQVESLLAELAQAHARPSARSDDPGPKGPRPASLRSQSTVRADLPEANSRWRFKLGEGLEAKPLDESLPKDDSHLPAAVQLEAGGWVVLPERIGDPDLSAWLRTHATRELFPRPWRERAMGRKLARRLLAVAATLLVFSLALTLGFRLFESRTRETRLTLASESETLRASLQEVEFAQKLIDRVEAGSGTGKQILSAWDKIEEHVPIGLTLSGLTIRESGALSLQGSASSREAVLSFMDALRSDPSGLLERVWLGGLRERGTQEQVFEIGAVLNQARREATP